MFKCNAILDNSNNIPGLEILQETNENIVLTYDGLILKFGNGYTNDEFFDGRREIESIDEIHDIIDIMTLEFLYPNIGLSRSLYNRGDVVFPVILTVVSIGPNCADTQYIDFLSSVCKNLEISLSKSIPRLPLVKIENCINPKYYREVSYIHRQINTIKEFFGFSSNKINYLEDKYVINILPMKLSVMIPNAIRKARVAMLPEYRMVLNCLKVASVFLISSPFFNINESDNIQVYI